MLDPEVLEQISQADSPLTKIIEFARTRRDIWPSRAAAREWFAGQLPWSQWDARVLDLYVVRALLSANACAEVQNAGMGRNTPCGNCRLRCTRTSTRG